MRADFHARHAVSRTTTRGSLHRHGGRGHMLYFGLHGIGRWALFARRSKRRQLLDLDTDREFFLIEHGRIVYVLLAPLVICRCLGALTDQNPSRHGHTYTRMCS